MELPPKEREFDGQSEQLAGPNPCLYLPGKHCEHMPAPVKPELQVHVLMLVVASSNEPEPTGQYEHAAEPKTDLNRPAAHGAHAALSGPVKPALHRHLSRGIPCAGDWELARQLAHSAGPVASLNVSTPHSVHVSPSASVYPELHLQCVIRLLPGIELELSGQKEQF